MKTAYVQVSGHMVSGAVRSSSPESVGCGYQFGYRRRRSARPFHPGVYRAGTGKTRGQKLTDRPRTRPRRARHQGPLLHGRRARREPLPRPRRQQRRSAHRDCPAQRPGDRRRGPASPRWTPPAPAAVQAGIGRIPPRVAGDLRHRHHCRDRSGLRAVASPARSSRDAGRVRRLLSVEHAQAFTPAG
jgi:hypothetical protein